VTLSSPSLSSPDTPSSPTGSRAESAELLRHQKDGRVRCYVSQFADVMEMRAPAPKVEAYLDRHEGWFRRCAAPMTVEPLASNGYRLTLGRFGNFGFEVEPTIGLELLPQSQGIYRIVTVPAGGESSGLERLYDVDFNASLSLDEAAESEVTLVRWQLDLPARGDHPPARPTGADQRRSSAAPDRAPDLTQAHLESPGGFPRQP
jgi:hypothetical protein